jgi:PrtD family type I secretion system ABC transporter
MSGRGKSNSPPFVTAIDKGLAAAKPAFTAVIAFSFVINLLILAGPLYMMQVYDRVLASRNITTLLFLTLILAFCYAVIAVLELVRSQVLIRAGVKFDRVANADVFRAVQRATMRRSGSPPVQALRDVDSLREFFTGAGFLAFLDFPWVPVYILASFLINFWYGIFVLVASVITLILALSNEWATKARLDKAQVSAIAASNYANTTFRNAEVLHAMGMVEALRARWSRHHESVLSWQAAASGRAGLLVALAKFHRMLTQSLVLGLGALLVLQREISPGMMIAASIIIGRALQPVEIAIGNWKGFTNMRSAYARVQTMLRETGDIAEKVELPSPRGHLSLENVVALAPGRQTPVLRGVSINIPPGSALAVVGPSAAGKSSLARVMTGIWPVASGAVRLDGSDLDHWNSEDLGRHLGYLPQDVELFSGSIAENIARFTDARDEEIIEAAMLAGVHEMIQKMPDGYNTQIGDGGQVLSGGQRQRVGLARALFRLPCMIVLDEPNANLDAAGEQALVEAFVALKKHNRTVVVVTHKTNILSSVDFIVVMKDGQIQSAGPRDEVLSKMMGPKAVPSVEGGRQKQPAAQDVSSG